MNSCELVTFVTAVSCGIANCVPKEDLPLLIAVFSELAATLATILEQDARNNPVIDSPTTAPVSGITPLPPIEVL